MKLQYLGDSRDAFKWDLLQWLCTQSGPRFNRLVFVPMLTPDDPDLNEGHTPQHWFDGRNFIRPFVISLREEPRTLQRITNLGTVEPNRTPFEVEIFGDDEHFIGPGMQRAGYWNDFADMNIDNSIVFFDPDNGIETQTRRAIKWIRHSELEDLAERLPDDSVVVVYQHRPKLRRWTDLFHDLRESLDYFHTVVANYEGNLAFLSMSNAAASERIRAAMNAYANAHPVVQHVVLRQ